MVFAMTFFNKGANVRNYSLKTKKKRQLRMFSNCNGKSKLADLQACMTS
jgi:hypothetical protein